MVVVCVCVRGKSTASAVWRVNVLVKNVRAAKKTPVKTHIRVAASATKGVVDPTVLEKEEKDEKKKKRKPKKEKKQAQ